MDQILVHSTFWSKHKNALKLFLRLSLPVWQTSILEYFHVMEIPCFIDYGNHGGWWTWCRIYGKQIFFIELMNRRKSKIEEFEAKLLTQISLSQRTSTTGSIAFKKFPEFINEEGTLILVIIWIQRFQLVWEGSVWSGVKYEKVVPLLAIPVLIYNKNQSLLDPKGFLKGKKLFFLQWISGEDRM